MRGRGGRARESKSFEAMQIIRHLECLCSISMLLHPLLGKPLPLCCSSGLRLRLAASRTKIRFDLQSHPVRHSRYAHTLLTRLSDVKIRKCEPAVPEINSKEVQARKTFATHGVVFDNIMQWEDERWMNEEREGNKVR